MTVRHVSEASVQTDKNRVSSGVLWPEHEFNYASEHCKVEHDHLWVNSHAALGKHDPLAENGGAGMLGDSLILQPPQPQQTSTPLEPLTKIAEEASDEPEPLSYSYACDNPDYEPPSDS